MAIKVILFDLDGTLLPMDQDKFIAAYFNALISKLVPYGYNPALLMKAIKRGVEAMLTNEGRSTNEQAFWDAAVAVYGRKIIESEPYFNEYYENDFDTMLTMVEPNPDAKQTVTALKSRGFRVALATNPVFPSLMTQKRLNRTGLDVSDFELCTTYENSSYSKPNLEYYRDIVQRLGVLAEECLMVGNDVDDDMVVTELGMKVFLLTDCLINKHGVDISQYPNGSFTELTEYVGTLK